MASLWRHRRVRMGRSVLEQVFLIPKSSGPYGKKCAEAGIPCPDVFGSVWKEVCRSRYSLSRSLRVRMERILPVTVELAISITIIWPNRLKASETSSNHVLVAAAEEPINLSVGKSFLNPGYRCGTAVGL